MVCIVFFGGFIFPSLKTSFTAMYLLPANLLRFSRVFSCSILVLAEPQEFMHQQTESRSIISGALRMVDLL